MQKKTVSAKTRVVNMPKGGCFWCGSKIVQSGRGRPRKFCSASCKQRAYESRKWGIEEVWRHMRDTYATCYLCGGDLDWENYQGICLDHMIATVYGGRTDVENLRPVHIPCNAAKGSKLYIHTISSHP